VAVLSFGDTESDTVFLRNAILRMVVSRAKRHLTEPADIDKLDFYEPMGAILFEKLTGGQRVRLIEAVYQGTQDLKQQVLAGEPTEEPVRAGIEEKLNEILALIACYRQ
jgi:hypothetical protein